MVLTVKGPVPFKGAFGRGLYAGKAKEVGPVLVPPRKAIPPVWSKAKTGRPVPVKSRKAPRPGWRV